MSHGFTLTVAYSDLVQDMRPFFQTSNFGLFGPEWAHGGGGYIKAIGIKAVII